MRPAALARRRIDGLAAGGEAAVSSPVAPATLVETLESVARSLRSGASLLLALEEVGLDEIARAARRGMPLADAIDRWAESARDDGAQLAAAALALAADIGGGAARSLDAVADTLRDREHLRAEVRALSTQARLSAAVIGLSPLAFALVVAAADPSNAAFLFTSSLGLLCLSGGIGLDLAGALWIRRIVRTAGAERDPIAAQRADVVDLFVLAVGAGLNVRLALTSVASRAPPAWAGTMHAVVDLIDRGQPVGDALDALPSTLGDECRALARVLAASELCGTALLPALERLAVDARLDRRRRAEEAARRAPVKLLFPLVVCVLPAFGLLTVAPLLAGALDALRL